MKNLLIYAMLILSSTFLFSCQKDKNDDPPTEKKLYPSRIVSNGKLSKEYLYNDNKSVRRINYYDTSGVISTYAIYEYTNKGAIEDVRQYRLSGQSTGMYLYEYDNQERLIQVSNYRTDTSLVAYSYYTYQHNGLNQSVRQTSRDADFQERYSIVLEYNGENMVRELFYVDDSLQGTLHLVYDDKISVNKYCSTVVLNSPHNVTAVSSFDADENGEFVIRINATTSVGYSLNYSVFEYNSDNYPVKQTITYTKIPNRVVVNEYEYIE